MQRYAMVKADTLCFSNGEKPNSTTVVAGEVVKVIQSIGNVSVIRPYNSRRVYSIHTGMLDFNIPQDEKAFFVAFDVRRLKDI